MSLTTRCPACGTLFRVVPDQLKISEGWVRCGRCSEVFDARASLSPHLPVMTEVVDPGADATTESPESLQSPEASQSSGPPADEAASAAPAETPSTDATSPEDLPPEDSQTTAPREKVAAPAFDLDLEEPSRRDPVLDAVPAPAPTSASTPDAEPALRVEPAASVEEGEAPAQSESPAAGAPTATEPVLATAPVGQAPAPDLPSVSFMRRARRAAFWHKPAVRGSLGVLSVVLALLLLGQMAYQQRDLLALRLPGLRPLLVALCQPLDCQVGLPRRIESVSIDASNFTRLPPEAFRLQLTLANAATHPVAMPAIELTLTDTQDQPVLRRVLQPADLGPDAPPALPAAGEWAGSVTLTVSPAVAGSVAGYRLLAFYP